MFIDNSHRMLFVFCVDKGSGVQKEYTHFKTEEECNSLLNSLYVFTSPYIKNDNTDNDLYVAVRQWHCVLADNDS